MMAYGMLAGHLDGVRGKIKVKPALTLKRPAFDALYRELSSHPMVKVVL